MSAVCRTVRGDAARSGHNFLLLCRLDGERCHRRVRLHARELHEAQEPKTRGLNDQRLVLLHSSYYLLLTIHSCSTPCTYCSHYSPSQAENSIHKPLYFSLFAPDFSQNYTNIFIFLSCFSFQIYISFINFIILHGPLSLSTFSNNH